MMKWISIVWICLLCSTSVLWGQLPSQYSGQAWGTSQTQGQIANNGVISGLHRTPNPMDSSHNWVMTGNVTGSKSFRGTVPYRASGDLNMNLGSSALDGFIRYSSPVNHTTGSGATYYSGNQSATYMAPGTRQTVSSNLPQGPSYQSMPTTTPQTLPSWQDTTAAVDLSDMQTIYPSDTTAQENAPPMPRMPWEEMQTITPKPSTSSTESNLIESLYRREDKAKDSSDSSLDQAVTGQETPNPEGSWQDSPLLAGMDSIMSQDAVNRMLAESESMTPDEPVSDYTPIKSSMSLAPALPSTGVTDPLGSSKVLALGGNDTFPTHPVPAVPQKSNEEILPFLQEARDHLQQGRAQEALVLYQRVAQWRPRDPAVLAGQCMANLAERHFMVSALFLSRWLEAEPTALEQAFDVAGSIGGQARLQPLLQEVNDYLIIDETPELLFLRAFIAYNTGDLERARTDIERALDLKPGLKGADTLRAAIER